jgi:hypothetical protein
MSYIEKAKQNQINAQKAQILDAMERDMLTEQAVQQALSIKEQNRINKLVSEFSPTKFDYDRQRTLDELDTMTGRQPSESDYAVAARNWMPTQDSGVYDAVNDYLGAATARNNNMDPGYT